MSRRISGNKGFVGQPLEDHDDDEGSNDLNTSVHSGISRRRSLGGRRRSSFGSHSSKNASSSVDQTRIAEMYKNVIKMSSENKINNKNSWNFDLIDQMGSIIKSDSTGSRGVNFQKASFTLDASVDIYSHRVDDTHSSSQTMLRNLSNADREAAGGDGSDTRGESRVGTKSASRKLNIANTIEANVSNINAAKIERVQSTDPMFLKMNKAFDDGGAKGMLMTNLRVSSTGCSLSFSSPEASSQGKDPLPATVSQFELVDISDLISRCGFDASSLLSKSVCPALAQYRETIGVQENLIGAYDLQDFTATFPCASIPYSQPAETETESLAQATPPSSSYISCSDFDYNDDDGDDNDNDCNDVGDFGIDSFADVAPLQSPFAGRKSVGTALNRRSSVNGTVHKIQWDSEPDRSQIATGGSATPLKPRGDSLSGPAPAAAAPLIWDATGISCSNEYSFFDIDMINKSNNWAGARHWKYATRRQAALAIDPTQEVSGTESGTVVGATDKADASSKTSAARSKSVKKKFVLAPLSDRPSEDLFAVPKARSKGSDVTCLTAAALEKESVFEAEGGLFLPPDAKLQTRDLCRLMLCHSIIVPPPLLAHVFMKQAATSKNSTGKSLDVIWGQVRRDPTASANSGFCFNPLIDSDDYNDLDDDDNDGGTYGEDFCDPDGDNTDGPDITDSIASGMERGLHISAEGLLRATRTVDKIDIGFATVAKKVNVKRLKSDIWTRLSELEERTSIGSSASRTSRKSSLLSDADGEGSETSRKRDRQSLGGEETSFQDLVCDISSGQRQKDVTLPFYFICLLHLANEKTLRIDGSADMTDLFISKDT